MKTLELFEKVGKLASYHYADDTGGEWGLGRTAEKAALILFDNSPHLHKEMREIGKGFLWSLNSARPVDNK